MSWRHEGVMAFAKAMDQTLARIDLRRRGGTARGRRPWRGRCRSHRDARRRKLLGAPSRRRSSVVVAIGGRAGGGKSAPRLAGFPTEGHASTVCLGATRP